MAFLYRVKQFLWSLDTRIGREDMEYVKKNLSGREYALFMKLSKQERKHSVKVARDVEAECLSEGLDAGELVKVSLLHDIGKLKQRLSSIDKSVLVIADKVSKGRIRDLDSRKVEVYFNHGAIGAELLKGYGLSERALYIIGNHHNQDIEGDRELDILRRYDGKN